MTQAHSILLIGESNVGKTHYGAQFLKRLYVKAGALRMSPDKAPSNIEPFRQALACLTEGLATDHTPADRYVESIWPIVDDAGHEAELVWPDYGGEQVRNLVTQRRIPPSWRDRATEASDWILVIRLHTLRSVDDLFSRPLTTFGDTEPHAEPVAYEPSDQSRMIELLQILLHLAQHRLDQRLKKPSLTILLSCWDELATDELPGALLGARLPLLWSFIRSNWCDPVVMGLSALERFLSMKEPDEEYATRGPEEFGYVILPDGTRDTDITLPVRRLLGKNP